MRIAILLSLVLLWGCRHHADTHRIGIIENSFEAVTQMKLSLGTTGFCVMMPSTYLLNTNSDSSFTIRLKQLPSGCDIDEASLYFSKKQNNRRAVVGHTSTNLVRYTDTISGVPAHMERYNVHFGTEIEGSLHSGVYSIDIKCMVRAENDSTETALANELYGIIKTLNRVSKK